jgi:hypothetical protein
MLASRSPMPTSHFIHNSNFGDVELNVQTSKHDPHPPPLFMIILQYFEIFFEYSWKVFKESFE